MLKPRKVTKRVPKPILERSHLFSRAAKVKNRITMAASRKKKLRQVAIVNSTRVGENHGAYSRRSLDNLGHIPRSRIELIDPKS